MPRTMGSLGKPQKALKDMILDAFGKLGGVDWLVEQAKEDPSLFVPLLRALVPRQVEADLGVSGTLEIRWKGESTAA